MCPVVCDVRAEAEKVMSRIDRKYLDVYEMRIMVECTCKYVAKIHGHPIVFVC